MGVKFAPALGAHTVLFASSESRVQDGKRLGADEVVVTNQRGLRAHAAQRREVPLRDRHGVAAG
jgi:uncharacterized zinc-type alcohol dehydrogenase-like protein